MALCLPCRGNVCHLAVQLAGGPQKRAWGLTGLAEGGVRLSDGRPRAAAARTGPRVAARSAVSGRCLWCGRRPRRAPPGPSRLARGVTCLQSAGASWGRRRPAGSGRVRVAPGRARRVGGWACSPSPFILPSFEVAR